ncbi:DMT family transporter [Pedobacter deserti]|uniref:DMT family transporter n=1 Tax=Pedobacter deserti TaxID=2817382 RepID=UPI00210E9519|nr:DMT family transporter [Pedobacter sp. SYSU D00382]
MKNNPTSVTRNLVILHLTVFVWGFTGILGALISVDAIQLVWYRVLIASITLLGYFILSKTNLKVTGSEFIKFVATGGVVAIHWVLFFYAIKASTVSVALVCLSSFTLFTALLEPLVKRQRILLPDVIVGLIIILGIYLIFKFESQYTEGIIFGLLSAFGSSLFATINSTLVQKSDYRIIGFYEIAGAFFWITLYRMADQSLWSEHFDLSVSDWTNLLLLGTICTALAYVAGVAVMRSLSAFRVALVTNLEPVYGILLAFIFFGSKEAMSTGFYAGSILILGAVFLYPIYKKRRGLQ